MLKALIGSIIAYFSKLRFPVLFGITTVLFMLDLVTPDLIPFADEILLGLGAALLARWKKRKQPKNDNDAAN